ncbi:hypothetical protein V8C86DRAFT_2475866 [Haematococcus lacustris]
MAHSSQVGDGGDDGGGGGGGGSAGMSAGVSISPQAGSEAVSGGSSPGGVSGWSRLLPWDPPGLGGAGSTSATRGWGGTDRALMWRALSQLHSLQQLHLEGWVVTEADEVGLGQLSCLHHLTKFTAKGCRNAGQGFHAVQQLTRLRELNLVHLLYEQSIASEFVGLSDLVRLTCLRFVTVGALPEEVAAASCLPQLACFEISSHYEVSLLPCLVRLVGQTARLTDLNLSNFELPEEMLALLAARHPGLTKLTAGRMEVTGGGSWQLAALKDLSLIMLDRWMMHDRPLALVTPGVSHLTLSMLPP